MNDREKDLTLRPVFRGLTVMHLSGGYGRLAGNGLNGGDNTMNQQSDSAKNNYLKHRKENVVYLLSIATHNNDSEAVEMLTPKLVVIIRLIRKNAQSN